MALMSFSPKHLGTHAKRSGLLQCQKCGLVWFGEPDAIMCPEGSHGNPVHVALVCRSCDAVVAIVDVAAHLSHENHVLSN